MKAATGWTLAAAVAAAGLAGLYYVGRGPDPEPIPAAAGEVRPSGELAFGEPGTAPPIRHPIEAIAPEGELPGAPELPGLEESDRALAEAAGPVFRNGRPGVLVLQDVIRRIVVTVDNLPRERVARRLAPLRPAEGALLTTSRGERLQISPDNAARYTPYVVLAEGVDLRYLVALYARFYPLFQQAFEELGYPEGYFNDRLVAVIDHLLATPEVEGPIELVQPKVLYQFFDPQLEKRSAGQKFLIRMGPDNAGRIKAQLRELRRLVVAEDITAER